MPKPTGESGITRLTGSPSGAKAEFTPIAFPSSKEEIEALIADSFLKQAPAANVFPHANCIAEKNPESDLDFSLKCGDGKARKLELMEIAPLKGIGSYVAAPNSYKPYDLAKAILVLIESKSQKYGKPKGVEQHLLLYNTDWRFILSQSAIALLQYWTLTTPHSFDGIYLYMPMSKDAGVSSLLFPTPADFWKAFNPEALKDNKVQNVDPKGWK
jgi:hypothetical protein